MEQAEEAAKTGAALGDTEEKAEAEEVDGQAAITKLVARSP